MMRTLTLTLVIGTVAQDARDLSWDPKLACVSCGATNADGPLRWALPGLCGDCAKRVASVTIAAPQQPAQQQAFFDRARMP